MEISDRLRQVIKSKGITWDDLSVNAGIAESTISRILNNSTNNPQKSTTQALAEYLQINEEWLRTGKGDMLLPTSTAEPQTHLNYDSMDKRDILYDMLDEIRKNGDRIDRILALVEAERCSVDVVPASIRDSQNPPPLRNESK